MKNLFITFYLCSLFFSGCINKSELTEKEAAIIENQIKVRVEEYIESVKVLDFESMLDFWSDSKDFVYAGDGRVLGGYKEWHASMKNFVQTTKQVLSWNNQNIHIKALSDNAASYTMEFEVSFIGVKGDTSHVKGAWTYVFEKSNGKWKVIHTNGTH